MHVIWSANFRYSNPPNAANVEPGRRRHGVLDQPRGIELGHSPIEHAPRRRRDAWQQCWTRTALILACYDGRRAEVLGEHEIWNLESGI